MSNMFKSETRPRQYPNRDQNRHYNTDFRAFNEKKKVEIKLTEADFPELFATDGAVVGEECKLNFKEAYLKEVKDEVPEEEPVPPGWTRYRVKNGVLIVDGESKEEEEDTAEKYHYNATQVFAGVINRWNNYKEDYDELNGYGAYDRVHSMPNYDSFLNDDWED